MSIRVKTIKVDLSGLYFPDIKEINDGRLGLAVEEELRKQGFQISNGTIDLPDLELEIKTRKDTNCTAHHTVGTMTLSDIINTPWDQTPIKQKIKSQFRVTFSEETGRVVKQEVIHLKDDPDIDTECKLSYEGAREKLKEHFDNTGMPLYSTYIKSPYSNAAILEHKSGNSYAYRILDSHFRKFEASANSAPHFNSLFERG